MKVTKLNGNLYYANNILQQTNRIIYFRHYRSTADINISIQHKGQNLGLFSKTVLCLRDQH